MFPPLTDSDGVRRPSLWREIADGSAGWGVRIVVAFALAAAFAGLGLIAAFALAAAVPHWNRTYYYSSSWPGPRGVRPRDELLLVVMLLSAVAWLGASALVLLRRSPKRRLIYPILATLGIVVVVSVLCIAADSAFRYGDSEIVIAGVILVGFASVLVVWVQAARALSARRPLRHGEDRLPNVRCPECGYRMVGLYESRCPECGKRYTLDELLARQNFEPTPLDAHVLPSPVPPLPPLPPPQPPGPRRDGSPAEPTGAPA